MTKFTKKNCFNEAYKSLKIARDEALKKGDVENLINISITFYEFATKASELQEREEQIKKKIGFVDHE